MVRPRVFRSRQFAAFLAVGLTASIAHWLYRYGLNLFMPYGAALALSYLLALITGFLLTKVFVFPLSRKTTLHQASWSVAFHAVLFPIVLLTSYILSERVFAGFLDPAWSRGLAHAIAVALPAGANFLLQKFIAFDA